MRGLSSRNQSSIRFGMIFRFPLTLSPVGHWYLHISCQQFPLSKSTGESEPTGIESLHGTAWCLRVRITESQSVAITEGSQREPERGWLKARSQHSLGKVERSETHPQVWVSITVTLAESQTQSLRGALMNLSSSDIPGYETSQSDHVDVGFQPTSHGDASFPGAMLRSAAGYDENWLSASPEVVR